MLFTIGKKVPLNQKKKNLKYKQFQTLNGGMKLFQMAQGMCFPNVINNGDSNKFRLLFLAKAISTFLLTLFSLGPLFNQNVIFLKLSEIEYFCILYGISSIAIIPLPPFFFVLILHNLTDTKNLMKKIVNSTISQNQV